VTTRLRRESAVGSLEFEAWLLCWLEKNNWLTVYSLMADFGFDE
jgi:hypothetical protein